MKALLFASIAVIGLGPILSAQNLFKPESIRIHASMEVEGGPVLNLAVLTKEQKFIRASIYTSQKSAGAIISYNGRSIRIQEKLDTPTPIRTLAGDDAAGNLLDLIALNPDYHFRNRDGFDFGIPIFKDYRVELVREEDPIEDTEIYLPVVLNLYKSGDDGETLIRSILYNSFFEQMDPYIQPKELIFTDETTGELGQIVVQTFEYNVGLPDFLFELPE